MKHVLLIFAFLFSCMVSALTFLMFTTENELHSLQHHYLVIANTLSWIGMVLAYGLHEIIAAINKQTDYLKEGDEIDNIGETENK